jgi:hypothetical protein
MRSLYYCILPTDDLKNLNFSQVLENSITTTRLDNSGDVAIVHWAGGTIPAYISDNDLPILNHEEALTETHKESWNEE